MVAPILLVLIISPEIIKPGLNEPLFTLVNLGVFWVLALSVVLYTRKIEGLPLSTIGWKPLTLKWILIAVGLGILLSLLVPVFSIITSLIFPSPDSGSIAEVSASYPWWILLLSVITAGVTEEILFRGYSLERLVKITGNQWISGLLSLVFFVVVHAGGWNIAHILGVVLPMGVILTGLYFWRRNLIFVIIVHTIINLPLVFLSLAT